VFLNYSIISPVLVDQHFQEVDQAVLMSLPVNFLTEKYWAVSSAGRAIDLHSIGRWFDPSTAHYNFKVIRKKREEGR
jgi:hypothetical protein